MPDEVSTARSESAGPTRRIAKLPPLKSGLLTPRFVFLGLSLIATAVCACAAAAHYRKSAWGDPWQPIGWLLSMLFLICAFLSDARGLAASFRPLIKPKTAFFVFWILFFVVSHLWNFRTAPWNGDSLFDESANDLRYLKSHIIGHPYQAAWFHGIISRETLFHYYVWGFLKLFGFNILSYEAALFVIWLTVFVFTLLLVDLFTFVPFAGRDCSRALPGQLHTRQAICAGAHDCCAAVRCMLLEELKANRRVELAGRFRL